MAKKRKLKVTCDMGCKKQFYPALKEVPCGDGVKQYFICPHCKQIYNVCKISKRGLEIRKEIQEAASRGNAEEVINLRIKMKAEVSKL